jgi:hypothetical protein
VKRILIVVVLFVVLVGVMYAVRARGADERAEADAKELFVPVIVTPSVQPANGQVLLLKATNVSEGQAAVRILFYKDNESVPGMYKEFTRIPPNHTVSYVYEPPVGKLTVGDTTIDAPEAVRAVFEPLVGGEVNGMRKIVANVQLIRLQRGADGVATLETPIVVPLQRCMFEPRGFVPYTGGRWYWNCAQQMTPLEPRWRQGGQANAGAR